MKKIKSFILVFTSLLLLSFSSAQVQVKPVYAPERFWPSDKFHAWCENQMDVNFHLDNLKINWVSAILNYDPNAVEILRVLADWELENNLTYTVESDKIILNKLKSEGNWSDNIGFNIFFKVKDYVEFSLFSFAEWSYVLDSKWNMISVEWTYEFQFAEVPECDPDIVAPNVQLLFPSANTWDFVALDTYFQFEISDLWKWINEDSIKFVIDGINYNLSTIEHEWSWNILTIYPEFWMPFNTWFSLEIIVSDRQVYGKPNITDKIFEFHTSEELYLLNEIDPVEFRKIVNMEKYYQWTEQECNLLSYFYANSDAEDQELLQSINNRLNCGDFEIIENISDVEESEEVLDNKYSVFSMIWWILFVLTVIFLVFSWLGRDWKK